MKPPIVIFVLLIAAFVVGDFAAVKYVVSTNQGWPDLPGIILIGLAFAQIVLLSAWFVFVRWNIAIRVLGVISSCCGLSVVVSLSTSGAKIDNYWFAIVLVAFCTAIVPMAAVRMSRWQINVEGQAQSATRMSATRMTVWQFSIWGLLSATTAVAIVLGTAKQVEIDFDYVVDAVMFFGCFALSGLTVILVVLGIKSTKLAACVTTFVTFVICPLTGMLVGVAVLRERERPVDWALFGFSFGVTMAFAVVALRIAGYRLSRGPLDDPKLENTKVNDLDVKVIKIDGIEESGGKENGGEENSGEERGVVSIDVRPSITLPLKIHLPDMTDVELPNVELPDVAKSGPFLSIRTESDDE
jgi:hypothetical protein